MLDCCCLLDYPNILFYFQVLVPSVVCVSCVVCCLLPSFITEYIQSPTHVERYLVPGTIFVVTD